MSIANELITRGWARRSLRRDDGSVCLVGAAVAAYPDRALDAAVDFRLDKELRGALHRSIRDSGLPWIRCPISGEPIIFAWNDDPARTFDEVLRVAKQADEILDA